MVEPSANRRVLATAVLVLASGALAATSPPQPPTQNLDDRDTVTADLTAEHPMASTRVTLSASDEALWSDDREVTVPRAQLSLWAAGEWIAADGSPVPFDPRDRPILRLTAVPVPDGRPLPREGSVSGVNVNLLEACPHDLDCLQEYEIFVEWLGPTTGRRVRTHVTASYDIWVQGPTELPAGAQAALEMAELLALDVPVLGGSVAGTAVVDARRPLAMWSVELDANEAAIPRALAWPTEARASFTAAIAPGGQESPAPLERGEVSILLISETAAETKLDVTSSLVEHDFDPFSGCISSARCARRLTIAVRWTGASLDRTATIDWRLDAGIAYHGDVHPTAGAELEARIASETRFDDESPAIEASTGGVVELTSSDGTAYVPLALVIPRDALARALLGGPVPAVTGTVTLDAQSSSPIEVRPGFLQTSLGEATGGAQAPFRTTQPVVDGGPVASLIHPVADCRADLACEKNLYFAASISPSDLRTLGSATITLTWRLEVRLQYPAGSEPMPGVGILLAPVEP